MRVEMQTRSPGHRGDQLLVPHVHVGQVLDVARPDGATPRQIPQKKPRLHVAEDLEDARGQDRPPVVALIAMHADRAPCGQVLRNHWQGPTQRRIAATVPKDSHVQRREVGRVLS